MAHAKTSPTKARAKTLKARAGVESKRKTPRRMLNGIPLKRKVLWVYDVDSPEFRAARRRDIEATKSKDWDRDGMQWVEAITNDPDWQKWWR
jgi:hypothetical protein